jgi:hypothetical protein
MDVDDFLKDGSDATGNLLIDNIEKGENNNIEEQNLTDNVGTTKPINDTNNISESHKDQKPNIDDNIKEPIIEEKKDTKKEKEDNRNKKIKEVIEEDKLDKLISYFKKIKNPEIKDLDTNDYDKEYGWFHCGKQNEANGGTCELGKEICPNCMKKTQELYKLKSHYLINSNGRICTYKKNKIYCLGKMTRVASETKSKENKEIGINYSISYTCGHTGQCQPCKNLTNIMDKYFSPNLMKKLKKRDETELN